MIVMHKLAEPPTEGAVGRTKQRRLEVKRTSSHTESSGNLGNRGKAGRRICRTFVVGAALLLAGALDGAHIAGTSFGLTGAARAESVSPSLIKKGQSLFNENCAVCHQEDAIGKPGVAPSLTNQELLSISSDKFLMGTIRDGREDTGMPPFAHLGRKDVRTIVQFLRSHQKAPDRSAEVDAQPDARGDPRLGQQWYNNICSTCHGIAGDGYESGGTGTAIGTVGFLGKASDGFIRETVKKGRSNTRMLGFQGPAAMANLSDQEIDDIIVYLRGLAE